MLRAIVKSMRRGHMDVALRFGSDLRLRVVERPGLWMAPEALDVLLGDLARVAARTLGPEPLTYGVFSGDRAVLERVIITLVATRDGTPIAFNVLAVMEVDTDPTPTEVLHLGLVMVDPEARSRNLSGLLYGVSCFLVFLRRRFRPVWVSNVTQLPAVVGMVSEMFSEVWPRPGPGRRTLTHLLLARRIMASHREVFGVGPAAGFDENRFIITDAYTGGSDGLKKTWEEAPKHRDPVFDAFCAERLDYGRGDDLIQLGLMDLTAMRVFLGRHVPRHALLGVLVAGGFVALQRLVLPVVHWADSSRHWSILRPARGRGGG